MMRNRTSVGLGGVCGTAMAAALFLLSAPLGKAQPSSNTSIANQTAQSQDAAAQSATASAAKPNLAGTWKLNEQQSDDPRAKMREAMSANGGDQGDSGAMNPGRTGRRPGRGRGGMMAQFSQLTIGQTDKGVNVTGASGRLIATSAPSKEDQNAQSNDGRMMMRMPPAEAKWQGHQLVATSQGFGGTITRTFELSPDGKQLYMTTKIENERFSQPVTYRLVYDPAKPENNSQ
jgi:hypothetical protein